VHCVSLFLVEYELRLPLLNAKKLIDFGMHLIADVFSWLQRHYNQLSMLSCEKNLPEVGIVHCLLLDVSNVPGHFGTPIVIQSFFEQKAFEPFLANQG